MQTSLFQLYSAPDCQVKVEKVPTAGRLPGRENSAIANDGPVRLELPNGCTTGICPWGLVGFQHRQWLL